MSLPGVRFGVAAVLIASGVWWARAQTTQSQVVWEFATVEARDQYNVGVYRYNSANICYHTRKGCDWDTVRVTVPRWSQTNDAVAAATARLGERGWEVVSATSPNDVHQATILMKRVRPVEQTAAEPPISEQQP